MWVGSIIYFIPFFFVLNPALVLQGANPYLAGARADGACSRSARSSSAAASRATRPSSATSAAPALLEWPLRVLLVIGGFVVATPGGGIMPLSQMQVTLLGLAILVPRS